MSQFSNHAPYQNTNDPFSVQCLGQKDVDMREDPTLEDEFSLFINWDPETSDVSPANPSERPQPSDRQSPSSQLSEDGKEKRDARTCHAVEPVNIGRQPTSVQVTKSQNSTVDAASAGPTAQKWVDALRMIEALDRGATRGINDPAQLAMAEDKRRRNNEASARFRLKKKQRDEEMVNRVKRLKHEAQELSDRIVQLEEENKVLRAVLLSAQEEKDTRKKETDGNVPNTTKLVK